MARTSSESNKIHEALVKTPIGLLLPHLKFDPSKTKKRALLIAPTYGGEANHWGLVSPIHDAIAMKSLLSNQFGYTVTTLYEGSGSDGHPTCENIKQVIDSFILKEDNVNYVLLYAGHSDQRQAEDRPEQDQFIIPCDALAANSVNGDKPKFHEILDTSKVIYDYDLYEALVVKIQQVKGSQLVAIFDSCHSCTLLNLRHHRCNRVGNLKSTIHRTSRRFLFEPMQKYLGYTLVRTESERSLHIPKKDIDGPMGISLPQLSNSRQCSGFCLRLPTFEKPKVICISAAKDSQITMESNMGGSLTTALISLFERDRHPTYEEIMVFAQQSVESARARNLQRVNEWYSKKKREETERRGRSSVLWPFAKVPAERARKAEVISEMKAHGDPQLSSVRPLRMTARLVL